jgi:hypothetical protein
VTLLTTPNDFFLFCHASLVGSCFCTLTTVLRTNCYDKFELTKCEIVDEWYDDSDKGKATVKFIAEMIQRDTKEKTGFMETATFEVSQTHGGWLYRDGTIEMVPGLAIVSASTEAAAAAAGNEEVASPIRSVDLGVDKE